jgi:serine/threonine-protein kinase
MSDSEDALQPGALFGSYQIVRVLGKGAFGVVYEAIRQPLGKRVALKVLHRSLVSHQEVLQRFLREAQTTAQIQHPHIVETFDIGEHEGSPYLAMEFLEGEPLSRRLKRDKRLAVPVACDMMLAVLSAMMTVHHHNVIHRDLKPDNIYLVRTRGGMARPKVLDFGIAKVSGEGELGLTRTTALLGTPYYMSPEQARESKNIDARSDQWALAVILYECVTGVRPFGGASLLELLSSIASGSYKAPTTLVPEIPAGLEVVIARALQPDPAQRFPDVRSLGVALLPFASDAARSVWTEDFSEERASQVPVSEISDTMEFPEDLAGIPSAPSTPSGFGAASASARRNSAPIIDATQLAAVNPLPAAGGTLTLSGKESPRAPSTPVPARGRSAVLPLALGAVVLTGLAGWYVSRGRTVSASQPPAAVVQARFRVRVRAQPETASIVLDREAPVVGAIDRELARDGRSHRVMVSAPGYRSAEFTFRDEFSVPEVALVRDEPPPAPPPPPVVAVTAPPVQPAVAVAPRGRRVRAGRADAGAPTQAAPETGSNGVAIR